MHYQLHATALPITCYSATNLICATALPITCYIRATNYVLQCTTNYMLPIMCYSALPITCYSAAAQYTLIPPPLTPSHTNNIEKRLAERLNMYTCKSTSYLKNFADYHATIMYISYTSALPQFKVLSPAYVIAKRRWRANSARTGTLVWIGSNKSNPLLLLEIKQHDVIV